jgi:hypothetical protein
MPTEIRFALAIPHASWIPERVRSMARLRAALLASPVPSLKSASGEERIAVFADREPPQVWNEKLMRWALTTDATHLVQIQDDALVAPCFWAAAKAMVEVHPTEMLGLHTASPFARGYAEEADASGETVRWVTTTDWLVGTGWIAPVDVVARYLRWRVEDLAPGTVGDVTEEALFGLFCMAAGRRIFHPIPAIIDHDVSIPSTFGRDAYPFRRPAVLWDQGPSYGHAWHEVDLEAADFWRGLFRRVPLSDPQGNGYAHAYNQDPNAVELSVRHIGRYYDDRAVMVAERSVKGWGPTDTLRARSDTGDREKRRMVAARRGRSLRKGSTDRVLICSPRRGGLHPEYASGVERLIRLVEVDVTGAWELLDVWRWHEDVARVRSRFVQAARLTDCTVIHWLDTDVSASPKALLGMLRSGHELVGTPYPRRDRINFERVAAGGPGPPEARAYQYPLGRPAGPIDEHNCAPVAWIPLGCAILRRSAFERMIHYYESLPEPVDLDEISRTDGLGPDELRGRLEQVVEELRRWRRGHAGLRFLDGFIYSKEMIPTVALFQLLIRDGRLWGEDQSFCLRAADLGIQAYGYFGPGSPATHWGEHGYQGRIEYFGLTNDAPEEPRGGDARRVRDARRTEADDAGAAFGRRAAPGAMDDTRDEPPQE